MPTGYYRVNYDRRIWSEIVKVLNDKNEFRKIHELNRAQILDDAIILASTEGKNYLPVFLVVKLYEYLAHEDNYYPWKAAMQRYREDYHFLPCKKLSESCGQDKLRVRNF